MSGVITTKNETQNKFGKLKNGNLKFVHVTVEEKSLFVCLFVCSQN